MNISEIKDLMTQFDSSSLREFAYNNQGESLVLSKNDAQLANPAVPSAPAPQAQVVSAPAAPVAPANAEPATQGSPAPQEAEGQVVESPLVGVAYLAPTPDKPAFVSVGDSVKKGQTLLIIEAMKVMNEVPAPKDGVVTEILVDNEEVVEFGKGLVRIK